MKKLFFLLVFVFSEITYADPANPTEQDAVAMVEKTVAKLEENTKGTLKEIFLGKEPYWPRKDRQFYVFVMDEHSTVIACPILRFMGKNYKSAKDENGKVYRNETVQKALKDKKGWTGYSIRSRGKIKKRKTYFKLFKDSRDNSFIVCCDIDEKVQGGNTDAD